MGKVNIRDFISFVGMNEREKRPFLRKGSLLSSFSSSVATVMARVVLGTVLEQRNPKSLKIMIMRIGKVNFKETVGELDLLEHRLARLARILNFNQKSPKEEVGTGTE